METRADPRGGREAAQPARLSASPWILLRDAAGGPRAMAGKVRRLAHALASYADGRALDARLRRLREIGLVERPPTRLQLVVGSVDMLRFWISPASAEYYATKGIHFGFHQLLRILDEPASMVDPTGFLSTTDNIIGHVMQVVHANPRYDLELLESHEGGLEELERQIEAMLAGTHPRAKSIGAIVEEPDYHARLLEYVRAYRRDRGAHAPKRSNVDAGSRWEPIERTFGTLPSAMRYFAKMPDRPGAALRHLIAVRSFPSELGEPA